MLVLCSNEKYEPGDSLTFNVKLPGREGYQKWARY